MVTSSCCCCCCCCCCFCCCVVVVVAVVVPPFGTSVFALVVHLPPRCMALSRLNHTLLVCFCDEGNLLHPLNLQVPSLLVVFAANPPNPVPSSELAYNTCNEHVE